MFLEKIKACKWCSQCSPGQACSRRHNISSTKCRKQHWYLELNFLKKIYSEQLVSCLSRNYKVSFPFTEILYFFPKHILSTEAKSVRKSQNEVKAVVILEASWQPLMWLAHWQIPGVANNILRIINIIASIWLPWTLSVPWNSQSSSSFALGKLFASGIRWCPQTNIQAYFYSKWRLLFI